MSNAPWNEPFARFGELYEQAKVAQPKDPNAMLVATVDEEGRPSARVCLLKDFSGEGFVFFTNYQSKKGSDLLARPAVALTFHWPALDRQVHVHGTARPVSDAESDAYFATRPRGSQLGAWASAQSRVLESRAQLEARLAEVTARYQGTPVPRPPHWGGFLVSPHRIEFWLAHPERLHFRELYLKSMDGWRKVLLSP